MEQSLKQGKISLFKAVMMGVNIMVGAGILSTPHLVSGIAGASSFLVWAIYACILLPIVYTVARFPEIFPGQPGFAAYFKEGLGNLGSFVGGWLYLMAYVFAAAAVLVAFSKAFATAFPSLAYFSWPPLFVALAMCVIFCYNMLPLSMIASISSGLTFIKLIPVLCAIALAPFFFKSAPKVSLTELSLLPQTMGVVLFAFVGFESLCGLSDKIEGGAKAVRKAIMITFALVTALYTMFHFSVLSIMGVDGLVALKATGYAKFAGQLWPLLGSVLSFVLPAAMIITYTNGSNGLTLLDSVALEQLSKQDSIRFGKWLARPLSTGRPLLSVIFTCIAIYCVAVALPDPASLFKATGLISMEMMALVFAIVIWRERNLAISVNKLISWLAFVLALAISVFLIFNLGSSVEARMAVLKPILLGLCIGVVVANYDKIFVSRPVLLSKKVDDKKFVG